jgi:hypothetical protein
MVWHIFKKDCRLLWPLAAGLVVVEGLIAFARFKAGHFTNLPSVPLSLLVLLASAIAVMLVVHQDPIPGVRQDWLVRPIPRRDLFLAKLLFVVVLVQGPMFVTDLLQGLANGFSLSASAAAALASAISVLLTLTVPVLAFAAVTASVTETLVAALGVLATILAFLIVPALMRAPAPTALTGFAWVPSAVREAVMLVAAASVLVVQYRWRRTWAARSLFVTALLIGQFATFLPWRAAFRVEQVLTASSANDRRVAVTFAPDVGRFRPAPGQSLDDVQEKPGVGSVDADAENQRRRVEGAVTVLLPLRVSGLSQDSRLLADRSTVTLIGRDSRTLYQGTGNDLELHATTAEVTRHQGVRLPGGLYSRVRGERVDVRLDYSFTLFTAEATYALRATDGEQRMPGIGWCVTKVDDGETRVLFQCLQPGERPSCLAVVLEHAPTRQRNPEVSLCAPDYTPYPGHTLPDALSRFGGRLPFYDRSGSIRYPVGGPQLSDARVVVTNFRPTEHFERRVVIAAVRLQDWEAQTPASEAASK